MTPKDEFRYGYRLWIDDSTAMPIRTQLCDARGRVIEQVVFSDLTFNARIPDSAFKSEVSTEGFQWLRNDMPSAPMLAGRTGALERAEAAARVRAQGARGADDAWLDRPVAHLVYLGRSRVRVRVRRSADPRAAGVGAPAPAAHCEAQRGLLVCLLDGDRTVTR